MAADKSGWGGDTSNRHVRDSWAMTFVASPISIAVGICAGLASALLVLSPVGGSMLAVPLTLLTQLPLVIATLGWGRQAAITAVLAGTGTLIAVSPSLAVYFVAFVAPDVIVASLAIGLWRPAGSTGRWQQSVVIPATAKRQSVASDDRQWFPFGQILPVVALLVIIGATLVALASGFDPAAISQDRVKALSQSYADMMAETDKSAATDELRNAMMPVMQTMLRIMPFAFTATWTMIATLNLGLGLWITTKSGNLDRRGEDLAAIDLPKWIGPVAIAALLVSFIGGDAGALALAICGAGAALELIAGLAVLHTITRPLSFRLPLLILVYLFLGLCGIPLILLGLIEPYVRLRHRLKPPGPGALRS